MKKATAVGLTRGAALFFGLFSLANAAVLLAGANRAEDLWWIDLSFLPATVGAAVAGMSALLLVAYGIAPSASRKRRAATAAAATALACAATVNAAGFYRAWDAGSIVPSLPLPFSAVISAVFFGLAYGVRRLDAPSRNARGRARVGAVVALLLIAFPLAQVAFFGTTDYRRPADAAVVLGARVHDDGTLSQSLEDRVRTGAELYRAGLVPTLVMSGGIGANGVDEAVAMKRRASELGVPPEAVLVDSGGVNTDATVADTTLMLENAGARRVLVVSQFYHLPRIKMAYRAAGWEVRTVPAPAGRKIAKTPLFVAREIPGFWVYWARAAWRDVAGG